MIAFFAALVEDRRLAAWTIGALAIVGGSVAPWVHIASPLRPLTELGLDADGKITILCGAAALAFVVAYARLRGRDLALGAAASAAASAALALVYLVHVRQASARVVGRVLDVDDAAVRSTFAARAGLGVWVVVAGSALVLIASLAVAVRNARPPGHSTPPNGEKREQPARG